MNKLMSESVRWRIAVYGAACMATWVSLAGSAMPLHAQQVAAGESLAEHRRAAAALLAKRVTVDLVDVSRKQALDTIARIAGVPVQYRAPTVNAYPGPITVSLQNVTFGLALERILAGTPLRMVADRKYVTIVDSGDVQSDSVVRGTVTGLVIDSAAGRALAGATVELQGTKGRAVTDNQGRFTVHDVPVGQYVMSVRLFGYRLARQPVTVSASERVSVRIAMATAPNVLAGVVTTATGVEQRRMVGNDITVLNADSILRVAPVRSVTELLEGRVPGLTVQHTSGVPGAPSRLRLRGVGGGLVQGAANTNDPIIIVDGVRIYSRTSTARDQNLAKLPSGATYTAPSPLDQIDPNSIETVEVMKGPSASSLYGPDAANGVIVVTTKKGRSGTTQLSAMLDGGVQRLPGQYAGPGFYLFGHAPAAPVGEGGSSMCGTLVSLFPGDISLNGGTGSFTCVLDSLVVFQALNVPRLSMTGTGTNASASVTATGGVGTFTYAATGSASNTVGYLRMPALYQDRFTQIYGKPVPQWMKRPDLLRTWSGSATFTSVPMPGLQVQYSTVLTNSNQRQSSGQNQLASLSSRYIDTVLLGSAGTGPGTVLENVGAFATKVRNQTLTTTHALSGAWTRWARFPIRADLGLSTVDGQQEATVPYGIYSPDLGTNEGAAFAGGYAIGRPTSRTQTMNVSGQVSPTGLIKTTIGMNVARTETHDFYGSTRLSPGVSTPSQLASSTQNTGVFKNGGWFIEPRLKAGERAFFAPGFRLDNNGLSGGGGDKKGLLALLPKLDFSWIALDREGEAPLFGILSLIRPRIAFGSGGIQPDPAWRSRIYTNGADTIKRNGFFPAIGEAFPGIQLVSIGNPLLRAERSRELEGGGDVQLWGNRVALNATGYYKLRLDAIQAVPIAPSAGGRSLGQYRNIGKIRNSGVELQLNIIPLLSASTNWTISALYSANRNVVASLDEGRPLDMGNGIRIAKGYPLNGRWGRPIVGYLDPGVDESGKPRKLSPKDVVVADSAVYLGEATPRYTLPVSSSLTLFGGTVGLSVNLNYEHGFTQFASGSTQLLTNLYMDSTASRGQQAAALAAFCQLVMDGVINGASKPSCQPTATFSGVVQTVNVLRVSGFSLNYNLPRRWSQRIRLPRVGVALQGSNLALWTSYRGKDPDVNGTPVGEALTDDGQLPLPRIWGLRITLGNR